MNNNKAREKERHAPLWLLALHPRAVRVRVRDRLWLRRVAKAQCEDPNESIADYIVRMKVEEIDARDRLESVRDAHDWGCDCTPDDPCRILIALNGGPSRPERDS